MKRFFFLLVPGLLLASFVAACGGGDGNDLETLATEAADIEPQAEVSVTAKGLKFDTDTIVMPADSPVKITFDNQDNGVLHNIAIYTDSEATEEIFKGELITGVETTTYEFTSPAAGVYYFKCDAHPDMNGAYITK